MKPILFKCILFFAIIIFTTSLNAQEKTENSVKTQFSLEEAIQYAIENGYDVKSKKIDLEIAKKKIWETTAIGLPQVNGTISYQHTFQVPEMSFPSTILTKTRQEGTVNGVEVAGDSVFMTMVPGQKIKLGVPDNTTWDITLSQLIFSGEYIVGLRASKVFREMSEQNLAKSVSVIRESVSSSYYLALVMDENVKILKESQKITDSNLKDIIALGEQGIIDQIGIDQFKIIKANVDNSVQQLERVCTITKNLLKFQMGLPIESSITITDSLVKYTDEAKFLTYLTEAFDVSRTIDYQVLETAVKLQKLSYDREKTTYLPTLAGFYRHYEQIKKPDFNFQPSDIAGLSVSVPIFSSSMRLMKVQQAKLNLEKMKLTQEQATEGLNLEYQNTLNEFQTAYSSYINYKQTMELAKRIFDQTIIKYKEGMSSSTDLNNAQTQLLLTQSDHFNSLNKLLTAKAKLDRMLNK